MMRSSTIALGLLSSATLLVGTSFAQPVTLDQNCTVSVFNRTVQVDADGSWSMPSVPQGGRVRARVNCLTPDGPKAGESPFFTVLPDGVTTVEDFSFDTPAFAPVELSFPDDTDIFLTSTDDFQRVETFAEFRDGRIVQVTYLPGINFTSSNPGIIAVDPQGGVTASSSGVAFVTARFDGVIAIKRVIAVLDGDSDGDGLPDDYETANGLDPTDPTDAVEDADSDGLSNLEEFARALDPQNADTDGDDIPDGEELIAGQDGFETDPLNPDTDGDGLRDGLEVQAGTDPTDANSANYGDLLDAITVTPSTLSLVFNTVDTETSRLVRVIGHFADGSTADLTDTRRGTTYESSNLSVVSFGVEAGRIFGGQPGDATVTIRNSGKQVELPVQVRQFDPTPVSQLELEQRIHDIAVRGDKVFLANDVTGLVIVDVNDAANPVVLSTLPLPLLQRPSINEPETLIPQPAFQVELVGDRAYLLAGETVFAVDISDLAQPANIRNDGRRVTEMSLQGQRIYTRRGIYSQRFSATPAANAPAGAELSLGGLDFGDPASPVGFTVGANELAGFVDGRQVASGTLGRVNVLGNFGLDTDKGLVVAVRSHLIRDGGINVGSSGAPILTAFREPADLGQGLRRFESIGQHRLDYTHTGIHLQDGVAYVGRRSGLMQIIDFRETARLRPPLDLFEMQGFGNSDATHRSYQVFGVGNQSLGCNDVVVRDGLALCGLRAGQNAVLITNVQDPSNAVLQSLIDFGFEEVRITGAIAADSSFVFMASGPDVKDREATETSLLLIGQFRSDTDSRSIPPVVTIINPPPGTALAEGSNFGLNIDAQDDVGVDFVEVIVDGTDVIRLTSAPYQTQLGIDRGADQVQIAVTAVDFAGNLSDVANLVVTAKPDADGDLLADDDEVTAGTDPTNPDTDGDGLTDKTELTLGTNPLSADSDSDGQTDLAEVNAGTDPLDPDVTAPTVSIDPPSGAQAVSEFTTVNLQFDELMQSNDDVEVSLRETVSGAEVSFNLNATAGTSLFQVVPKSALKEFTSYTFNVSGFRDLAGNPMTPAASTFETGDVDDSAIPFIASSYPRSGASNHPANAFIEFRATERLDAATVNADSAKLCIGSCSNLQFEPVAASLSADGLTVRLVPLAPLLDGQQYFAGFIGANRGLPDITDLSGNAGSGLINFRVTTLDDLTPPLGRLSQPDGATAVPLNALLAVAFDEEVNELAAGRLILLEDGNEIAGSVSFSTLGGVRIARLEIGRLLLPNTSYSLSASGFSDLAGNTVSGPLSLTFQTGDQVDNIAPTILGSNPADGVLVAPASTSLRVVVDEALSPLFDGNVPVRLSRRDTVNGSNQSTQLMLPATLDDSRTVITLAPPAGGLRLGDEFRFQFTGALFDLAGNQRSASGSTDEFTIGDQGGPAQLRAASLPNAAIGVPTNASVSWLFDSPLSLVGCNGSVFSATLTRSGGGTAAVTGTLEDNGRRLRVTPDADLAFSSDYSLSIDGLCDLSGNAVPVAALNFSSDSSGDNLAPSVIAQTPPQGAVNVAPDTTIRFDFNEAMDLTALGQPDFFQVDVTPAGASQSERMGGSMSPSADGTSVVFTPFAPFPPGSTVDIDVVGSIFDFSTYESLPAVVDVAGNALQNFSSSFTIVDGAATDVVAPTIVNTIPADGAVDVRPGGFRQVSIRFSESMRRGLDETGVALFANGERLPLRQSNESRRSADGRSLNLRVDLPASSVIAVVVTNAAVDLSGNPAQPTVVLFTTGSQDIERPRLQRGYPQPGSADVPLDNPIHLQVNRPVLANTLNPDSFSVTAGGLSVSGARSVLGDGRTLQFVPDQPWPLGALVQARIGNQVIAENGRELFEDSIEFMTVVDPLASPVNLLQASPLDNLPLNPVIDLRFSRPLDPLSINNEVVTLQMDGGGFEQPGLTLRHDNRVLRVQALSDLVPGGSYTLSWEVRDSDQNTDSGSLAFTIPVSAVSDQLPPQLEGAFPTAGSTSVPTNTSISLRFSEGMNPIELLENGLTGLRSSSVELSPDGREVFYLLHSPLPVSSNVNVDIAAQEDLAGLSNPNLALAFDSAAGPDFVRPTVLDPLSTTRSQLPPNAVITTQFDDAMDPLSLLFGQACVRDAGNVCVPGQFALNPDQNLLSFVPDQAFAPGTYTVRVDGARDVAGNTITSGSAGGFEISGQADATPPQIQSASIPAGAVNVPRNALLLMRASEPIAVGSFEGIRLLAGGEVAGRVVRENNFDGFDRVLFRFLTDDALLAPNTQYTLEASGLVDLSGNVQAAPFSRSFATGSTVDLQPPAPTYQSPAEGFTSNFDRDTKPSIVPGGNLQLHVRYDEPLLGTLVRETFTTGSFQYRSRAQSRSFPAYTLLLGPNADEFFGRVEPGTLDTRSSTQFNFSNGGRNFSRFTVPVFDLAGNSATTVITTTGAIAAPHNPPFEAFPVVGDGLVDVPLNANLHWDFDRIIDSQCERTEGFATLTQAGNPVPAVANRSYETRSIELIPTVALQTGTEYVLTLQDICDVAGNPLSVDPLVTSFTTSASAADDLSVPMISEIFPADTATGIDPGTTSFSVTLNEPVAPGRAFASVFIQDKNGVAPASFDDGEASLNAAQTVFTLTLAAPLTANTQYDMFLTVNVEDIAGNTQNFDLQTTFTTSCCAGSGASGGSGR